MSDIPDFQLFANDLATYDEPELVELLKQLADTDEGLLGTLFDEDELDTLISDEQYPEQPKPEDTAPITQPTCPSCSAPLICASCCFFNGVLGVAHGD